MGVPGLCPALGTRGVGAHVSPLRGAEAQSPFSVQMGRGDVCHHPDSPLAGSPSPSKCGSAWGLLPLQRAPRGLGATRRLCRFSVFTSELFSPVVSCVVCSADVPDVNKCLQLTPSSSHLCSPTSLFWGTPELPCAVGSRERSCPRGWGGQGGCLGWDCPVRAPCRAPGGCVRPHGDISRVWPHAGRAYGSGGDPLPRGGASLTHGLDSSAESIPSSFWVTTQAAVQVKLPALQSKHSPRQRHKPKLGGFCSPQPRCAASFQRCPSSLVRRPEAGMLAAARGVQLQN